MSRDSRSPGTTAAVWPPHWHWNPNTQHPTPNQHTNGGGHLTNMPLATRFFGRAFAACALSTLYASPLPPAAGSSRSSRTYAPCPEAACGDRLTSQFDDELRGARGGGRSSGHGSGGGGEVGAADGDGGGGGGGREDVGAGSYGAFPCPPGRGELGFHSWHFVRYPLPRARGVTPCCPSRAALPPSTRRCIRLPRTTQRRPRPRNRPPRAASRPPWRCCTPASTAAPHLLRRRRRTPWT